MRGKINFGVVGLGAVCRGGHLPTLHVMPQANIIMVCDINEELAKKVGKKYGVEWTTNYEDIAGDSKVDAVTISTPHHLHYEVALAMAKAKKHIFCEKPFAIALEQCDNVIDACKEASVKLMIAENYLFEPAIQIIKKVVNKGMLGELKEINLIQDTPIERQGWRWKKIAGGGAFLDPGVHLAALARYFMGEVKSVSAKIAKKDIEGLEVEDTGKMIIEFTSGNLGVIGASWRTGIVAMRYEIEGSLGRATFNIQHGMSPAQLRICSSTYKITNSYGVYSPLIPPQHSSAESYANEFKHFIDCIINDKDPLYDGKEGRKAVEMILAGYKSAKEGKSVTLPLKGGR